MNLTEPISVGILGEGVTPNKKVFILKVIDPQKITVVGEAINFEVDYIIENLKNLSKKYPFINDVYITGDDPEVYQEEIYTIVKNMNNYREWFWEIETEGNKKWEGFRRYYKYMNFNFKPKIGTLQKEAVNIWKAIMQPRPLNYIVKAVVSEKEWDQDIQSILKFQKLYKVKHDHLYLMPHGTKRKEILKQAPFVIEKSFDYNYNFSPRLQIIYYNK